MSQTRVAVVTGGGGGLGAVIGAVLATDGFQVVLAGRSLASAQRAADGIGDAAGPRPQPGTVDIGDADSVTGFVQDVGDRFGRLDVLVNNAGAEPSMTLQGATVDAWDLTMTVNVRGAILMCQAALPFWREQGAGSIVNISSRTYLGSARNPAYASSKAAVVGLTKELAVELGPLGGRSNAVAPSAHPVQQPAQGPRRP
ncbi:MAG TPA: SDR family oxidoreductase, partial [Nakamurella sp.]